MWNTAVVQGSELGLYHWADRLKKVCRNSDVCAVRAMLWQLELSLNVPIIKQHAPVGLMEDPWSWVAESRAAGNSRRLPWRTQRLVRLFLQQTQWHPNRRNFFSVLPPFGNLLWGAGQREAQDRLTPFTNTLEPPLTALMPSRDGGRLCKSSPSRFVSPGSAESSRQRQVGTEWRLWQKTFSPSSSPF